MALNIKCPSTPLPKKNWSHILYFISTTTTISINLCSQADSSSIYLLQICVNSHCLIYVAINICCRTIWLDNKKKITSFDWIFLKFVSQLGLTHQSFTWNVQFQRTNKGYFLNISHSILEDIKTGHIYIERQLIKSSLLMIAKVRTWIGEECKLTTEYLDNIICI